MFDILRRVIAKERAELVELLISGNIKDRYDALTSSILTLDRVEVAMTDIEKKMAGGDDTDETEETD
jgi:ribosomal protein S3AE